MSRKRQSSHLSALELVDLRVVVTIALTDHTLLQEVGKGKKQSPAAVLRLILENGVLAHLFAELQAELNASQQQILIDGTRTELTESVIKSAAGDPVHKSTASGEWLAPDNQDSASKSDMKSAARP